MSTRNRNVGTRVSPETLRVLRAVADYEGETVYTIVRTALLRYLGSHEFVRVNTRRHPPSRSGSLTSELRPPTEKTTMK